MIDEPENLVLVYLRRLDAGQTQMQRTLNELMVRQNDMARQIAGMRRDQAGDLETVDA